MSRHQNRLIVMLAYDGVNLIDIGGPLQAFASAGRLAAPGCRVRYDCAVASASGGVIVTAPGLPVITESFSSFDRRAIDTLIIPGGSPNGEPVVLPEVVSWISHRAGRVRRICSVCTGAFALAATGILNGRRATTHWDWAARLQATYPKIRVDANPIFIRDDPVWTSAGVTAGIDLSLALIEDDLGHGVAIRTARQLVMFIKRPGGQSQFSAPLSSQFAGSGGFGDLHAWIANHLAGDLRVEVLARRAGMSPRTFARLYKAHVGRTPAKTVEAIRLEAACRALEETDAPAKFIAAQVGYGDAQRLRRAFQRDLGISPTQYRERFSRYTVASDGEDDEEREDLAGLGRAKTAPSKRANGAGGHDFGPPSVPR